MAETSTTDMPRFRSYLKDVAAGVMGEKLLSMTEAMTLVGDELDGQIKIRKELMWDMVGTLYPSILRGEIASLQARKVRTDKWHGLYRD